MKMWSNVPLQSIGLSVVLGIGFDAAAQSLIMAWGDVDQTRVPGGATNVVEVTAGHYHNLSLSVGGALSAWPVSLNDPASQIPRGLTNVVSMAAGVAHDMALQADGTVVVWGDDAYGQTNVPAGLNNIIAISAGGYHCVCLKQDGSLAAWGNNSYGQLAIPASATNVVAISSGFYHNLALRADGTVVAWGDDSFEQIEIPANLTNAVAIAAGGDHCLALTDRGTVVAWGDDAYGQSTVPADLTNAMGIAAGDYHSLALRPDGTVVAWGPFNGATVVPAGLSNVVAVAAGGSHSLALVQQTTPFLTSPLHYVTAICGSDVNLSAGISPAGAMTYQWRLDATNLTGATQSVLVFNNIQTNQTGLYSLVISNHLGLVSSIATEFTVVPALIVSSPASQTTFAGTPVNLGVSALSTVPLSYQWLLNGTNVPGATSANLDLLAITPDQAGVYTVVLSNSYGIVTSPGALLSLINIVQWSGRYLTGFNGGDVTGLALSKISGYLLVAKSDGTLATYPPSDPELPASTNFIAVAVGWEHRMALAADRTVTSWGYNDYGQTNVPPDLTNVVAIASGDFHGVALKADGTVGSWGANWGGQTNVPTGLSNVVAIAAGANSTLAVTGDGHLALWGNSIAAPPDLTTVTNVIAVAAGDFHFLALKCDGTVTAWGDNSYGLATVPSNLTNAVALAATWDQSMALTADGRVVTWGYNSTAQTNVLANLSNVVAIATGSQNIALIGSGPPRLTMAIDRAVAIGSTTSFAIGVRGLTPFSCQWQFYGTNLPGATNRILTLADVQPQQAGRYSVTVSNLDGVASGSASLSVTPVLINWLSVQPFNQPAYAGSTVLMRVAAQGLDLSFQWLSDGVAIPGATDSALTLTNVQLNQAGAYSVIVSNSLGQVTSDSLALNVLPLWITSQTPNQTNYAGGDTSFSVSVAGTPPLAYVWEFNGVPIPGATDSTLTLTNLQFNQSGIYSVIVSNAFGTTNNAGSWLSVQPFLVQGLPQFQTNFIGDQVSLTAQVQGVDPIVYQWQFNGANLDGATTDTLTITNATSDQTGTYSLMVSNNYGAVTSVVDLVVVNLVEWQSDSSAMSLLSVPGDLIAIAASSAGWALAAKADGTVVTLSGSNSSPPSAPGDLTNVVFVEAGWRHGLALHGEGTLSAWGDNLFGQTNVPPGLSNVVSIAAGAFHNLALKSDGTLVAWGDNRFGQTNIPVGLSNIVALAAGTNDSLAVTREGQLFAWGADNVGNPLGLPSGLSNIVGIVSGSPLYLALRSDRTVALWLSGSTEVTFPPELTNVVTVGAQGGHDVELLADGTLTSWADPTNLPVNLFIPFLAIAAGGSDFALFGGPPILAAAVIHPSYEAHGFSLEIPTQSGRVYSLEYKNSLADAQWAALPLIAGNGRLETLSDPSAPGTQRFYRVQQW